MAISDPRLRYSEGEFIQIMTKEGHRERIIPKQIKEKIHEGYIFTDGSYLITKYEENANGNDGRLSEYLEYNEADNDPILISIVERSPDKPPIRTKKNGGVVIKPKRTHRKNKQHNHKTKKGGWLWSQKQTPSDDPHAYEILTKNRPNLPINDGKRYAELQKINLDLRDYHINPNNYDDDEHKTWRDVESTEDFSSDIVAGEDCTEPDNNCDLSKIPVPDETSCSWFGDGALYSMLSLANKSEVTNGTELVTIKTDLTTPPMGEFECDILKSKIKENFEKFFLYKNCPTFKKITSFKMYGHFFKKKHLSLVTFAFNLFGNLKTITLGIDPESFNVKDSEHECLETKNNIKFTIIKDGKYGTELVATRGELTGGKKRKTNKNRKGSKKNKSSKK